MKKIYDSDGFEIKKRIRVKKYSKYHPMPFDEKWKEFERIVKSKCKILTKSGIFVQSWGEKKIADFLYGNNIDFDYDVLIEFGKDETPDMVLRARPDFVIKGNKTYIEYWGLKNGSRSKPDYDERTKRKIALYKQEGVHLIEVFCEDLQIFSTKLLEDDLRKARVLN